MFVDLQQIVDHRHLLASWNLLEWNRVRLFRLGHAFARVLTQTHGTM